MNTKTIKYLFWVLPVLGMMASCQRTQEYSSELTDSELVPVQFKTNVVNVSETKGSGSVTGWDASQTVYVYGIERLQGGSFGSLLIDNVAAQAPDSGTQGAIDVYNPAHPGENIPFYYGQVEKYDFFAYYVDDAFVPGSEVPTYSNGAVTLPVKIDGTQDILLGYADRTAAEAASGVPADRLYSAYGVRKSDAQPVLSFEHVLSRLVFNVIAGSTAADPLYLKSLTVESKTEGVLTVAGASRGLAPSGEVSALNLTNRGADLAPYLVSGTGTVGESVMVMPGSSTYNMSFQLEQAGHTVDQTAVISIDGGAVKGKSYTVNMTVYSLESIKIDITLEPWGDGDVIEIGADEDEDSPLVIVSNTTSSHIEDEGGDLELTITTETEYSVQIDADWVSLVETKTPAVKHLTFAVAPNPGGEYRTCTISFVVNAETVASYTVTQGTQEPEDPGDEPQEDPIPDDFGIIWQAETDFYYDPAVHQMSIYKIPGQGSQWFRFISPSTLEVYEIGPIPFGLEKGDSFAAEYSKTLRNEQQENRALELTVADVAGGVLKMREKDGSMFTLRY